MWNIEFCSPLLGDLEFALAAGDIVALVGKNGAGKSHLLNGLANFEAVQYTIKPSENGLENQQKAIKLSAKNCAYLPQHHALAFALSVKNILDMAFVQQCSFQQFQQWQATVLAELQLTQYSNRLYTQLSGGEKQRVQIARVLCQLAGTLENKVLLLDEPFAALDIDQQAKLITLLKKLAGKGLRMVIALHEIALLGIIANQCLLISAGNCQYCPIENLPEQALSNLFGLPVKRELRNGQLIFEPQFST